MRRLVIGSLTAIAALAATASATAELPRAKLRSFVCQQAFEPAKRAMSVTAVMRPVPGTMKMAMRFELFKRAHRHSRSVSVSGQGLKTWITPKDSTLGQRSGDQWILKHPVVELAAPAYYRLRVTFRWSDAAGHALGRAVRVTALCFQPELRPDLRVASVAVSALANGNDGFLATIRNAGRTAAGTFRVELGDGSAGPAWATVSSLGSHQSVQVYFEGPACSAASPAKVTVDPDGDVEDYNRANNSQTVTCAATTASWRQAHRR